MAAVRRPSVRPYLGSLPHLEIMSRTTRTLLLLLALPPSPSLSSSSPSLLGVSCPFADTLSPPPFARFSILCLPTCLLLSSYDAHSSPHPAQTFCRGEHLAFPCAPRLVANVTSGCLILFVCAFMWCARGQSPRRQHSSGNSRPKCLSTSLLRSLISTRRRRVGRGGRGRVGCQHRL